MPGDQVVVHVIDDDEAVRQSLAFLLGAAGIKVQTYESARAFLDVATKVAAGCVITDVRMPDIDGLELLRRLKASAAGLPVIVMTGHGDVPDALSESGLLSTFRARGGRYLWIANLDNLGATVDPLLLGEHIDRRGTLSVEVVEKEGDKGGIPVRFQGRPVICEDFRLPRDFAARLYGMTTLGARVPGSRVNLEIDPLARYARAAG